MDSLDDTAKHEIKRQNVREIDIFDGSLQSIDHQLILLKSNQSINPRL
jgi:hypothetical protein